MSRFVEQAAVLISLLHLLSGCHGVSMDDPSRQIDARNHGLRFVGNKSAPDHFRLLQLDGSHLLIGARNVVYNISVEDFSVRQSIIWSSSESDIQKCQMYGKSLETCHNYVRVLAKDNQQGSVLVCGTNAFAPLCREYYIEPVNGTYVYKNEFSGQAISPYDPAHNSTALYLSESRQIYAGTVADFTGVEPLVHRRYVDNLNDLGIRTERSDTKCLNDPNFVGSFDDEEHVFFWFREDAVEYTNCGKAVYSRVARICKNDQGSSRDATTWTTFLKARLNCSLPGDYPFYFDEIEAISDVVHGTYGAHNVDLIYAVFNTPFSAIRGSAVCAFNMNEVKKIFAKSPFKSQPTPNANWQAVLETEVPEPRPGSCEKNSRLMPDEVVAFAKANPLMDEAVPNFFSLPVMIYTGLKDRFTQIAVDSQVPATDGLFYDVIFIGTDHGRVLKVVNLSVRSKSEDKNSVVVETVNVFEEKSPVRNLLVYRQPLGNQIQGQEFRSAYLVVVSDHEVRRLPLHNCARAKSCSVCVQLRDPYCAWSQGACVGRNEGWSNKKIVQSVGFGYSSMCPPDENRPPVDKSEVERSPDENIVVKNMHPPNSLDHPRTIQYAVEAIRTSTTTPCNCGPRETDDPVANGEMQLAQLPDSQFSFRPAQGRPTRVEQNPTTRGAYSAQSLAIGIVLSVVVALIVGFIGGYQCKKRECLSRKKADPSRSSSNGTLNLNVGGKKRESPRSSGHINAYEATPKYNGGIIMAPSNSNSESPISMDMVLSLDSPSPEKKIVNGNTNTLPKDYKVKKMYL